MGVRACAVEWDVSNGPAHPSPMPSVLWEGLAVPVLGGARMVTPATSWGELYSSRLWLGELRKRKLEMSRLAAEEYTRVGLAQPALAHGHQAAP